MERPGQWPWINTKCIGKKKKKGLKSRDHSCYSREFKSQPCSLLTKEKCLILEIEQILTHGWYRNRGTELLSQDSQDGVCATVGVLV